MKTNAIIRIVIHSIVLLLLVSILGTALLFDRFSFDQKDTSWVAPIITAGSGERQRYDYAPSGTESITRIQVEWAAGTITIQPGETDQILFYEQGSMETDQQLVYSQAGNKLTIQYQKQEVYIGIHSTVSKDLVITVPRDWSGEVIEIEAAAANVQMRNITVREVEFDSASGTALFDGCALEKLDIDTASGDIEFYGTLNILDFDAMSAKLTAVLENAPRSMELDTMSGDVDLTLPADCGFTVSIDAASSDFSTDFDTTTKKGSHIHGDGSCHIDISAMSGDVAIRKSK